MNTFIGSGVFIKSSISRSYGEVCVLCKATYGDHGAEFTQCYYYISSAGWVVERIIDLDIKVIENKFFYHYQKEHNKRKKELCANLEDPF